MCIPWRAAGAATLLLGSSGAMATEGGGNSYPTGVETNYNGVMLPEGLHAFVYAAHYEASHMKDDAGRDNPRLARFGMSSDVLAVRLSFVWPGVRLFGATVETRVVQAAAHVRLSLGIARPAPLEALDRDGSGTGLADTAFSPVILGWHAPAWHHTVGLDTHLNSGGYDVADHVNTGRNYAQAAPFAAFTWFPSARTDLNAKLRYAVNGRNKATDYRSGDEATLEFSAGYRVSPALALGMSGYLYRQTTDDRQNGARVNGNGNRGRADALGPYVNIRLTPHWSVIGKLQSEFDVRNRPQGTRLWLQTRIPL